ncbi:MAG: DedA family protein [Anaerolineales bacterium]|nr:DedA family protein [Anaerolineales bacterium]
MDLSDQILTAILTYGATALGIIVFLAAIGVPFPSSVVVIASGAFIEQGYLELLPTLFVSLLFVVTGDVISYFMGHLGRKVTGRWTQSPNWKRAETYFQARGAAAIFLTRCLLTPLAVPTNLIAGGSHFPVLRFMGLSTAGEFTWLIGYGGLGYAFGSQWEYISELVSNFSGALVGIVLVIIGLVWLRRNPKKFPIANISRRPPADPNAPLPSQE